MKRIVNSQVWEGTAAEFATSTRVFYRGDTIFVRGDTSTYKKGDGVNTLAALIPFQTQVKSPAATAINATATATAAQLKTGLVTSTSAAAVSITLPSAANLLAVLGTNAKRGSSFDLTVDNSAGANIVTIVASASITAITAVLTGSATLTVAAGAVGVFRIYFVSTTAAKIARLV